MLRFPMINRAPSLLLLSLCTSVVSLAATPDEMKCKNGNATACATAGRARLDSEEYALAKRLLEKGCKHGSAEACDDLGWVYDDGLGIDVNKLKAEEFYGKACTGNFGRGCTNQGVMYLSGEGIEKDPAKATTLFTKAWPTYYAAVTDARILYPWEIDRNSGLEGVMASPPETN